MIVVSKIDIAQKSTAGCNNGILKSAIVTFNTGEDALLYTCRCGKGCNGADRLPEIGDTFKDLDDFWIFANPEY